MHRISLGKISHHRLTPRSALGVEAAIFLVSLAAAAAAVNLFGSQFLRADAAPLPVLEARCLGQASGSRP